MSKRKNTLGCNDCKFVCDDDDVLADHRVQCHGDLRCLLPGCTKMFSGNRAVRNRDSHFDIFHTGKEFECSTCGVNLKHPCRLAEHKRKNPSCDKRDTKAVVRGAATGCGSKAGVVSSGRKVAQVPKGAGVISAPNVQKVPVPLPVPRPYVIPKVAPVPEVQVAGSPIPGFSSELFAQFQRFMASYQGVSAPIVSSSPNPGDASSDIQPGMSQSPCVAEGLACAKVLSLALVRVDEDPFFRPYFDNSEPDSDCFAVEDASFLGEEASSEDDEEDEITDDDAPLLPPCPRRRKLSLAGKKVVVEPVLPSHAPVIKPVRPSFEPLVSIGSSLASVSLAAVSSSAVVASTTSFSPLISTPVVTQPFTTVGPRTLVNVLRPSMLNVASTSLVSSSVTPIVASTPLRSQGVNVAAGPGSVVGGFDRFTPYRKLQFHKKADVCNDADLRQTVEALLQTVAVLQRTVRDIKFRQKENTSICRSSYSLSLRSEQLRRHQMRQLRVQRNILNLRDRRSNLAQPSTSDGVAGRGAGLTYNYDLGNFVRGYAPVEHNYYTMDGSSLTSVTDQSGYLPDTIVVNESKFLRIFAKSF